MWHPTSDTNVKYCWYGAVDMASHIWHSCFFFVFNFQGETNDDTKFNELDEEDISGLAAFAKKFEEKYVSTENVMWWIEKLLFANEQSRNKI